MTHSPPDQFDDTGKAVFDHAYNQPDPRMYYNVLGDLGYKIAGEAQPLVARTISVLADLRNEVRPKVIDIGSSYGINAALLNNDLSLGELDERYRNDEINSLNSEQVIERDKEFFRENQAVQSGDFVGIDISQQALDYALDVGLLENALAVNLEQHDLATKDAAVLSGADLLMSTGAVGYVGESTFEQILAACEDSRPWVANSVLRMFSYNEIRKLLDDRGYVTEKYDSTLVQRKFATEEEQSNVLGNLRDLGIDPSGKEANGDYHAEFFLSRPREEALQPLFERLPRLAS